MNTFIEFITDQLYHIRKFFLYKYQKIFRGFGDNELWNFDTTIAKYIVPRLKRFKELQHGYPANLKEEEWNEILDQIIYSFELKLDDKEFDEELRADYELGLIYFAKYFDHLWD
jgi:hypothetical protein